MNAAVDTIVARATAAGNGGIGVVRISGPTPRVEAMANQLLGTCPQPRLAHYTVFKNAAGHAIDAGIALYFPAPHSFTGEAVLELQGHGGLVVLNELVEAAVSLGARRAEPGEFSKRAFLNDKIDLTQAEAIADLISAQSSQAARSAFRSLQGDFAEAVRALTETLIELRCFIEAAIDFPDEDIEFLEQGRIARRLQDLQHALSELEQRTQQGVRLREGLHIVIAGAPNAGKSSLLNCLSGQASAIVTDIPGTTRDALNEWIDLDGLPLHLVDTAGLRAETSDVIEQMGMVRTRAEIAKADRILIVQDSTQPLVAITDLPADIPVTYIMNKIDLLTKKPQPEGAEAGDRLYLSTKTGEGLMALKQHLKHCAGLAHTTEGAFSARSRHLQALRQAGQHINHALWQLTRCSALELSAEDLRLAHHALGEITGEFTADDLLGKIFSSFCIGK